MNNLRREILYQFQNNTGYSIFNQEREQTMDVIKQCIYPNLLAELVYPACFSARELARAGNVSEWVLLEVLRGDDMLEEREAFAINRAFFNRCGYGGIGYLFNNELSCYNMSKRKHYRKVRTVMRQFVDVLEYLASLKREGELTGRLKDCYNEITLCGALSRPKEVFKSGIFLRAEYNMIKAFIKKVDNVKQEIPRQMRCEPMQECRVSA